MDESHTLKVDNLLKKLDSFTFNYAEACDILFCTDIKDSDFPKEIVEIKNTIKYVIKKEKNRRWNYMLYAITGIPYHPLNPDSSYDNDQNNSQYSED